MKKTKKKSPKQSASILDPADITIVSKGGKLGKLGFTVAKNKRDSILTQQTDDRMVFNSNAITEISHLDKSVDAML